MVELLAPWPEDQRKAMELWGRALEGESFNVTAAFGPENREPQTYDLRFNPVHDERGRRIGAAHILRNVTERVRMQQALRESEEHLRSVLESTTDGYLTLDRQWRYTYFNERGARLVGMRREELIGGCVWDLFPAARDSKFYTEYHRAVETGQPVDFEEYYSEPLNKWLEVHAYPTDEGLTVFFRDITERKRSEEALRESERRFKSTFENAAVGMAHVALDGRFIRVNESLCRITGYPPAELAAKTFQEITHPDDLAADLVLAEALLKEEKASYFMEKRYIRKDGSIVWINLTGSLQRGEQARPEYFIAIVEDISDRKQAEEALRESEERYRTLFESIDEGFCVIEMRIEPDQPLDYRFIEVNRAFEKHSSLADAKGKWMRELRPEHEESWFEIYRDVALTGEPVRFEHGGKALENRWFTLYAFRVGTPDQRRVAVLFNDITERKQAAEALRRSEEHLRTVLDNLVALVGVTTPDGTLIEANRVSLEMGGIEAEEVLGKPFVEASWWSWSPEVQEQLRTAIRKAAAGESSRYDVLVRMAGGRLITIDFMLAPLCDEQGRVKYLVPSALDVSERVRAQETLREKNETLALIADTARMLLTSDTPERITQKICEQVMTHLGSNAFFNYLIEEGSGRMHLNAWAGVPEELAREIEWLDLGVAVCGCVARDGCRLIAEDILHSSDPRTDLVRSLGIQAYACHPLLYQGRTLGTLSFGTRTRPRFTPNEIELMRTIADLVATAMARKRAEDAVAAGRAKLEAALNSMTDAVFISDAEGRFIELNDAFATFHRFNSKEECAQTFADYPEIFEVFMAGGELPREQWAVPRALRGETVTNVEYMVRRKDTGETWAGNYSFGPIRDQDGTIVGSVVTARDVTEQKRAEEALQQSNATLEAFFASSPAILNIVDDELRYVKTDPMTPSYFGLDRESIVGKAVGDLAPEFAAAFGPMIRRVAATGEPALNMEVKSPVTRQPGETAYWQASYFPVPLIGGKQGIGVIGVDISNMKKAEMALRESEERFRTLADNMSQFAWMTDEKGWIFWYNKRWYEYTGTALEDMEGWGWRKTHHPDQVDRVVAKFSKAIATGEVWEDTFPLRGKDGQYRWFLSRAVPIRDEQGRVRRWFGTNTDITELREAQLAIEKTVEELARSNRELEQFAYIASHDLQTPLRAVTGFLDLLSRRYKGQLGPEADEFISFAVDGAQRMHQLINDILAYSRVGTRGKPLERLESGEPLARALGHLKAEIEESGAEVTVGELPAVTGDRNQLAQLFQNLVGNAIKYRKKEEPPRIRITAEEKTGEWQFRVRDNSIGFDPQHADRIFQIFQRLHTISEYPGTGIGLAICRKIIERHGGRIWAESEPGQGATFFFTLPKA
jgi:PAS domain S-box-containing protein